jgi:DnaJ-class molecular chaperone
MPSMRSARRSGIICPSCAGNGGYEDETTYWHNCEECCGAGITEQIHIAFLFDEWLSVRQTRL